MAYIQRTQGGSGNQKTFTISLWIKRARYATGDQCFLSVADGSDYLQFKFNSDAYLEYNDGPSTIRFITSRKFKDLGAWYHIVVKFDSTQAIESDRFKMFINGVQETAFGTATYPGLNTDSRININTGVIALGVDQSDGSVFEGVMSWVQLVDGTALDATEFGEVDSTSGIWKIKTDVYGTPGVNGFCLKMEDRTNLDLDSSSNAHTFTTSGNVTATYDNPSNNFCTINPLSYHVKTALGSLANGNTTATAVSSAHYGTFVPTLAADSGKWYVEGKVTVTGADRGSAGVVSMEDGGINLSTSWYVGEHSTDTGYQSDGNNWVAGSSSSGWSTYTTGDIIGIALDLDNRKVYFHKNGVYEGSGDPVAGTNGLTVTADVNIGFAFSAYNGSAWNINYGNGYFGTTAVSSGNQDDAGEGDFEYDVPAGYYCLCTKNIKAYGG